MNSKKLAVIIACAAAVLCLAGAAVYFIFFACDGAAPPEKRDPSECEGPFVGAVDFIGSRTQDIEAARKQARDAGWTVVSGSADKGDLNRGYDLGYTINLCHISTPYTASAIRGLRLLAVGKNSEAEDTLTADGMEWTKIPHDLNDRVGGDYVFLYFTTDPAAGAPITDIAVQWLVGGEDEGVALFDGQEAYNINQSVRGGKEAYLCISRFGGYISGIAAVSGETAGRANDILEQKGFTPLGNDLGTGTAGAASVLGCTVTENAADALYGIALSCVGTRDKAELEAQGYTPAGGNLKEGCGTEPVFLYTSREAQEGAGRYPITELAVRMNDSPAPQPEYGYIWEPLGSAEEGGEALDLNFACDTLVSVRLYAKHARVINPGE